jgi:hypothetical protein
MTPEAIKDYCATHANLALARQDPLYFSGAPKCCDACGRALAEEEFLCDCEVPGKSGWAFFGGHCIAAHRLEFDWGRGQMYQRVDGADGEWLLVAGFPPPETD